jgi:protein gp37
LSIEPLIAPVAKISLDGIAWVIVGGESGYGASHEAGMGDRHPQPCLKANVAFFFKQWGGRSPKTGGRLLEGKEWSQFPMRLPASRQQLELQVGA